MTKEEYMKDMTEGFVLPEEVELIERIFDEDIAPREKQIQIDAEQIRALQKLNGELTDKVKELEAQIEKMKCCENCKYHSFWGDELKCNYGLKEALQEDRLIECKNKDKWELAE